MGFLDNLKLVKQAMSPEAMKQGWQASQQAMANPTAAGATPEQLAAMAPEQRAAYEANLQRIAAAQAQISQEHRANVDREMNRRALYGDAGEHVYGAAPSPQAADQPTIEDSLAASKEQLRDLARNPFGGRKPQPPPPTAPTGPVDRDQQAAAEFAAREAARRPYLAPAREALTFTRFVTKRKSQQDDVAAFLATSGFSGRPDLVYGVYRVPDDIDQGTISLTRNRVVEWEVVHAATHQLTPSAPPGRAYFEAKERWVARRAGDPAPLDEDVALEYLWRAGVAPHECLGIARFLKIDHDSGDENASGWVVSQVVGVLALHSPHRGAGIFDRLRDERPLQAAEQAGIHIDVLNWGAVADAVHPDTHRRFVIPSAFPYLPSTPQELLQSYLQIVGIRASDTYGAQVTEDMPRDIMGRSSKGFMTLRTNRGEQQPCADGQFRPRLAGGDRIVVVYRDRPEYAEGRGRWAAYQRDVLQAELAHDTNVRRAVAGPDFLERGVVGKLLGAADAVYNVVEGFSDSPFAKIPPYRYCWPPLD